MSAVELTEIDKREVIADLVTEVAKLPPVDFPVTHRFAPGVYLREIFMPKNSIIIGKIHKTEHFNVIIKGSCSVWTVDGYEEYEAPATFVSRAGIQKIVYMHEDCQWQTIHVTDKTDIDDIEKDVIAESYNDPQLESLYKKALGDIR